MSTTALEILNALKSMVGRVSTANGFQTNAGARVYLGAEGFGDEDTYPLTSISNPGGAKPQRRLPGAQHVVMQQGSFEISGLAECDKANPILACYALIADYKRAIFGADAPGTLRALVEGISFAGETPVPPQDGTDKAQGTIVIDVLWKETVQ